MVKPPYVTVMAEAHVLYAVRKPRAVFIESDHTGTAPLRKNWSYYKRTGSLWEDIDHIPPARLQLFLRPDLGYRAAQAINRRYEQEQALADMRVWAQAVNRAKLRRALAERREVRERVEDYVGLRQRPRTQQSARAASRCARARARARRARCSPFRGRCMTRLDHVCLASRTVRSAAP